MRYIIYLIWCVIVPPACYGQAGWINEFHYDNSGVDTLEMVEVVIDVTQISSPLWRLFLYDGISGMPYDSASMAVWNTGMTTGEFQFYSWYPTALQNGPDAIALCYGDSLIQFISYEGEVIGTSGPAMAKISQTIAVSENNSSLGQSLQLKGPGSRYAHFWWELEETSPELINDGQFLTFNPTIFRYGADSILFGTIPFGDSSLPESYLLAGANLTEPVSVTIPPGFEISLVEDFSENVFTEEFSIGLTEDFLQLLTLYIRFTPLEATGLTYEGTIMHDAALVQNSLYVSGKEGPYILPNAWINEIHYDNDGPDIEEFVELVISIAYADEIPYLSLHFYNGNNNLEYKTSAGTDWEVTYEDPAEFFYLVAMVSGIQNGAADGIALAHRNRPIQFLSYEGTLMALDGPVAELTSEDIGVMEETDAPVGSSLQLVGTGGNYEDFLWVYFPEGETRGMPNQDQLLPVELLYAHLEYRIDGTWLIWKTGRETQNAGYIIEWSESGKGYEQLGFVHPAPGAPPYLYNFQLPEEIQGYIRLVQEDLNGRQTPYSPLRISDEESIFTNATVRIYSVQGEILKITSVSTWEKDMLKEITNHLRAGLYIVRISQVWGEEIFKVIKQ